MNLYRSTALAAFLGGEHKGKETTWEQVAVLDDAGPHNLAFDVSGTDTESEAGVLLVKRPLPNRCCIVVGDPKLAFIRVLKEMFHVEHEPPERGSSHIHSSAVIHPSATIHPGSVIMAHAQIGADSVLFPSVVLYPGSVVGARVRIHAGTVIGADGFGYHPTPSGPVKIPHIGRVVIEDDVEIGANCTIDRAFVGETRIGAGAKLDNMVHVGHNCHIGRGSIIAAQTGLSGSVSIGAGALIGGQVGVVEHTIVGAQARIGAQSGVTRDVDAGDAVLGTPAEPAMKMKRIYATLRNLPEKAD